MTMGYKLFALDGPIFTPTREAVGAWVKACDVDARGGRGSVEFTADRAQAMPFPTVQAALDYWKRPSTVCPLRDDGKPNRPLTAFTVQPVEDGREPLA